MKLFLKITWGVVCTFLALPLCAQQPLSSRGRLSLPDKSWAIGLDLPGYLIRVSEIKPDGRRYMFAENAASGVIFSIFLEEVTPGGANKGCRENLEARSKAQATYSRKNIKLSESGEMFLLEYLIPEIEGVKLQQQNLFVCIFKDNVYIDMHFSKTSFKPGEEKLFHEILKTVQFEEGIARTSLDYVQFGSLYYASHDYKKAIAPYQMALELEQKSPMLDKTMWTVLVDNLGMAYGMTGDLEKSKETFEYGISKDPTYPLFYYNMACYYGEKGDADNAAAFLKKAFEHKGNTFPGETMPDPRQDDSFKRLLKNRGFRNAVDAIVVAASTSGGAAAEKKGEPVLNAEGPLVRGTLMDLDGPIRDAQIILQFLRDDKCAQLFQSKDYSEKKVRQLEACSRDLPATAPDSQGRFHFVNLHPGWYVLRFLWTASEKPGPAMSTVLRSGFGITYAGRKDFTGKYDTFAQSMPFYFSGKEDFVIAFDYHKP